MSRLALITTICGVKTGYSLTTDIPARGHGLHDEDGGKSHAREMEEDGLIPTEFGNRDGWSGINEAEESGKNYSWFLICEKGEKTPQIVFFGLEMTQKY